MNIRLVTVIWGADFVSMYLRVGLRSLVAEGNLIDLARIHKVVYTIYTTESDAGLIQASPFFSKLIKTVNVQFSFFSRSEIDSGHYGSHNVLWQRGLDIARRNKEILFFLIPDLLYARGTLLRWASRFEEGCRALYTPGPQVVLETILPEIEKIFSSSTEPITLESKDITRLLLMHLHPMHAGMIRGATRRVPFAEYDIRPVKGIGFVFRELSAQPFCVDPAYFEKLINFSPADHLHSVITEPCSTLSVEPLYKRIEWYYRPWRLDDARLTQLGGWWDYFGPPGCIKDSETAHEIVFNDISGSGLCKLQEVIDGGRFFRSQLLASKQLYKLLIGLSRLGMQRSAEILSMAMYSARLRRKLNISTNSVLLIPSDKAFAKLENDTLKRWVEPGRESELIKLIQDHILPSGQNGTMDEWLTARGFQVKHLANQVRVTDGPIYVNGFSVYIIDTILDWERMYPKHNQIIGLWGYPAWVQGTSKNKLAYFLLFVPFFEALIAAPFYFSRLWLRLLRQTKFIAILREKARLFSKPKLAIRSFYHRIRLVPGVAPLATSSLRIYRFAIRLLRQTKVQFHLSKRSFIAILREQARLFNKPKFAIRSFYCLIRSIPGVANLASLLSRIYRLRRRIGNREFIIRIIYLIGGRKNSPKYNQKYKLFISSFNSVLQHYRVMGKASTVKWIFFTLIRLLRNQIDMLSKVDRDSAKLFDEVQLVRSLISMSEILKYYSDRSLSNELSCPPLQLIDNILEANGLNKSDSLAIERALTLLAFKNPNWSECWLELGYLSLDRGDKHKAMAYFKKSSQGVRITSDTDYVHPCSIALTEMARLYITFNKLKQALNCFSSSLVRDPRQPFTYIEYAKLLRHTGQGIESLKFYLKGISFEETRSYLPKGWRDARYSKFLELKSMAQ